MSTNGAQFCVSVRVSKGCVKAAISGSDCRGGKFVSLQESQEATRDTCVFCCRAAPVERNPCPANRSHTGYLYPGCWLAFPAAAGHGADPFSLTIPRDGSNLFGGVRCGFFRERVTSIYQLLNRTVWPGRRGHLFCVSVGNQPPPLPLTSEILRFRGEARESRRGRHRRPSGVARLICETLLNALWPPHMTPHWTTPRGLPPSN